MTAADSVVSRRRREPLFESIFGRFFSLNHRTMHTDQVQVRVRVRAFRVLPGQPLGRARQEQWLRAREERTKYAARNFLTGVGVEVPSSKNNNYRPRGLC